MVSIRLASAAAVLLALAGCTASADGADSIAISEEVPPIPLAGLATPNDASPRRTGCLIYDYTEGECNFHVVGCPNSASSVCVTAPPPNSWQVCEMGGSVAEAMGYIQESKVDCFPCTASNFTKGKCTYTIDACQYRSTVGVFSGPRHAREYGGTVAEAMDKVKAHNIEC